jgi:hypothetical protein
MNGLRFFFIMLIKILISKLLSDDTANNHNALSVLLNDTDKHISYWLLVKV